MVDVVESLSQPSGAGGRGTKDTERGTTQGHEHRVESVHKRRKKRALRAVKVLGTGVVAGGAVTMIMMRLCSFHLCDVFILTLRGRGEDETAASSIRITSTSE